LDFLLYAEFIFDKNSHAFNAFKNIGRSKSLFVNVEGLIDCKLMGAGNGSGFSIWPNLKRYAILFFFDSITSIELFIANNQDFRWYIDKSQQSMVCILKPFKAHGLWNGKSVFTSIRNPSQIKKPIAVITRATIKTTALLEFWKNVPKVAAFMHSTQALHQIGIGEYPIFMQATFSIWKDLNSLRNAAYNNTIHAEVVKKTRQRGWYKEELFAEFDIIQLTHKGETFKKLSQKTFDAIPELS